MTVKARYPRSYSFGFLALRSRPALDVAFGGMALCRSVSVCWCLIRLLPCDLERAGSHFVRDTNEEISFLVCVLERAEVSRSVG